MHTEAETPLDWAHVSDDLGWTLRFLGERTGSREMLEEARAMLQRAWDIYRASGQNLDSYFGRRIAEVEAILG